MMKKRIISILLAMSMVAALTGCGNDVQTSGDAGDAVELVEPVNAESSSEVAARRNMYSATVYSAYALPYIEEYAFSDSVTFDRYGAFPGEQVKKGDVLLYSDTTSLDSSIEKAEESLKAKEEQHIEYVESQTETIEDLYHLWHNAKNCYDVWVKANPDSYDEGVWQYYVKYYEGQYKHYQHQWNMAQIALEQNNELYELDYAYESEQLKELKAQSRESKLVAEMDGYVVSLVGLSQGDWVNKDVPVVAIGDTTQKIVKCGYINKATAEKAKDMYAFVNGKRYEVEYQAMDTEEYNRLSAQGETIYTTFIIKDEANEIQTGDFVVINLVNDSREDVLSVSKSAIKKDENGYYVFVNKDGESVYTRVETGFSDGTYTEILEGLNEGDVILSEDAHQPGVGRTTLAKGTFSASTEVTGSLGYPSNTVVKNEIAYGTTYFVEYHVENYQIVSKGDVLATVRVEEDTITLNRWEKQLQRANERLNDILNDDVEDDEDTIAAKREAIAEIEETIAEIKADFATTTIKADRDGVIVGITNFEAEDIVQKDQNLFYIADADTCYIEAENKNMLLNFGNEVSISYNNADSQNVTVPGTVANISELGLSSALHTEYVMVLVPSEYLTDMANSLWGNMGGWWNRNRFTVTAKVREMDNVVVIPRSAVWSTNGNTYVDVVDKNGNVVTTSFVAGGFDATNYWVIEGLEEGMEICLE